MLQLVVPCGKVSSLPNLEILIHGVTYTLTSEQYILKFAEMGQSLCISGAC